VCVCNFIGGVLQWIMRIFQQSVDTAAGFRVYNDTLFRITRRALAAEQR
jgi:hypothetical protein